MPLKNYGVLIGKAIDTRNGIGRKPHFQVLVSDDESLHRIAINVKSKEEPSSLLYFVDEDFDHPLAEELTALSFGFHHLESRPGHLSFERYRNELNQRPLNAAAEELR